MEEKSPQLIMEVLPVISYCLHQNGLKVLRSLTAENSGTEDLRELRLEIHAEPPFLQPWERTVDLLPAGETLELDINDLHLDPAFLSGITERIPGTLYASLSRGQEILARDQKQTAVLAYDEWHGTSVCPELLASFVTPNHPEISRILAGATEHLGRWTGDTSLDGYQSRDPDRVLKQAAAIFTALREQAISYIVPPASFERLGQRVRLCDQVLSQKLGTCLDLTVLYAACLEAAGLHALMITMEGHIFSGLWLEEKMFPETVEDDISLLTKRLAEGVSEIAVVETTCVTTGREVSFDEARMAAERNMEARGIEYIIDLHRARLSGIRPLPMRISREGGWHIAHEASSRQETMEAPRALAAALPEEEAPEEPAVPKLIQWERKLLDLGLRNSLLNMTPRKMQIPILTASLDDLEDALADGGDFSIRPRPMEYAPWDGSYGSLGQSVNQQIIQEEFRNQRLHSVYSEGELGKALKDLYRSARTAMEENGANTLYLSLGMLRWFETERSTRPRFAPIILLPVEMVRKSAAQGYVIRLRDEEPQMNVTLLEKLKQDFGIQVKGTSPLPEDEHGIDIRRVFTILRRAVMDQPRWDVVETAVISIFTFSQFVMWNDVHSRSDDLMNNKIVRSLVDGRLSWQAEPLEMGDRVPEDGVLLPMPADASQLFAIEAACSGKSFVLHGPPGTGKSQTITSLIVNALAQGKNVLFVAEKMAALEVVRRRLQQVGVGPFCLELHSNKSRKKDVLEQLREASEVIRTVSPEQFQEKAEALQAMRRELDAYVQQLHRVLPCGTSLYTLISSYEAFREEESLEPLSRDFLASLRKPDLEARLLALEQLLAARRETGNPSVHPLKRLRCGEYSQSLRSACRPVTAAYGEALRQLEIRAGALTDLWKLDSGSRKEDLQQLRDLAETMVSWYALPADWAAAEDPPEALDGVSRTARAWRELRDMEQQILLSFREDVFTLDGEALYREFLEASSKWVLPRALALGKLARKINLFAKLPVPKSGLQPVVTLLRNYSTRKAEAKTLLHTYGPGMGQLNRGENTVWEDVDRAAAQARSLCTVILDRFGSYAFLHAHGGSRREEEQVRGFLEAWDRMEKARSAFEALLKPENCPEADWISRELVLCDAIASHEDSLREWTAYVSREEAVRELGLSNCADFIARGGDPDRLIPAWKKTLLEGLISLAMDESPAIGSFSGAVFNEKIQQYRRADETWRELSRQVVYCRLAAKIPNFTREAAHSSELGILQRCIRSGGRGTSIRRLFDQIPTLLPRLCPCMLMSPISAAQYLDPRRQPFDIVVFDEASQLPTCKAVGVLARGENAVIVGDPKQMPPTSFFASGTVDEENLELEDLESILDDCLALNMPQAHLLWHYRSRHESLIAFSNLQFYENKLLTFPSVNDRESRVRLVHVDGVFDRGRTRTNPAEARAVVEEIRRRAGDPVLSAQSLGVVTFNASQQNLIDDLLVEACAGDPDLEKWVYGSREPVFIKNLENVQGDERDVILFSIAYGPDEAGRVYMNFGPLNRDGGWRRLNVAVSRARCEMMVFAALDPDQIDLNRTKSQGVAALKKFLEYAQGRPSALREAQARDSREEKQGVAASICRFLRDQGYTPVQSVGHSAYRVDIGVVDPGNPEVYLLGIMLDGSSYREARTTRDREIAQLGVLEGLGWNLLRVWSADWWDNSQKECRRILEALKALEKRKAAAPAALPEPAPRLAEKPPVPEIPEPRKQPPVYRALRLQNPEVSSEDFLEPRYQKSIRASIRWVLEQEAPVSQPVLIRRVVQSYGIARSGKRIQAHMEKQLAAMDLRTTAQGDTLICWNRDQDPAAWSCFRVSGEEEDHRDIRDVPVQEIGCALCSVLLDQSSMSGEDLQRETAKALGYTRMGGNVLSAVSAGIQWAGEQGLTEEGPNHFCVLTEAGTARARETQNTFVPENI